MNIPYDVLGRSLSGCPFFPKDVYSYLKDFKNLCLIKHLSSFNDFDDGFKMYMFDFINDDASMIKRYSDSIMIYGGKVKDDYDLLLALVYGFDGVLLDLKSYHLSKQARRFGLSVVFVVENKLDLIKASFYKADIFYVLNDLFFSIPKEKVIISKINHERIKGLIV